MNPLDNLKDIHTPNAIENWPPAYGWWLLALIIVVLLFLVCKWALNAYKIRAAKRLALKQLALIDNNQQNANAQLNQLLKRVAMSYFPAFNVQQKFGETWVDFLKASFDKKQKQNFVEGITSLQTSLYQQAGAENFVQHKTSVETWLKTALPPKKSMLKKLEQKHA